MLLKYLTWDPKMFTWYWLYQEILVISLAMLLLRCFVLFFKWASKFSWTWKKVSSWYAKKDQKKKYNWQQHKTETCILWYLLIQHKWKLSPKGKRPLSSFYIHKSALKKFVCVCFVSCRLSLNLAIVRVFKEKKKWGGNWNCQNIFFANIHFNLI